MPNGFTQRNSMFYGAMMLTAGSLGLRLVQMIFQVYISGVMGAAGLGRMQLIMTVGGFAAVLASGGVRIAATCLAAEEAGKDRPEGVRTAIRCCCVYGVILSLIIGFGLFVLADLFARLWIGDASAALPLRIFAVSLPITVLWSVFSGYYTAAGRITELVGLEFFERLLSILLVVLGIKTEFLGLDPCTQIFLGSTLATFFSFLLLLRRYKKTITGISTLPFWPMMRRLLTLTVPLGFNDILKNGLNAIENIIVPMRLRKNVSVGDAALASYGTICGMVFPVITFPSVILYSLSDLLVPEMARCRAKQRQERTIFLADKCLRLTMLFAVATAGLGLLIGEEIGYLLFRSREAGVYIRIFAPLIIMLYVDAIVDGMLKGLSQQIHTVRYNTLTSFLDVVILFFLLPEYGIGGYLFSFTVTHAINFFLSIRRLIIVTGYLPSFHATIKATICCALSLLLLWNKTTGNITLMGTVLPGVLFLGIYLLLILFTGALKKEDLSWIFSLIKAKKSSPSAL